ncbi:hypothetical protein KBZ10_17980 [Streptomyces sp. F63]|uniref:hypothetical protein n=1 Tax=Streptomyces sp. F63 TaxID=2824887 RepID=UPI001B3662CD|nr:hypothetical protein [Streptomyces sp. F63]MBQ0986365.1 hypothetical protein [Streptomyces sp. F63]
MRTILAGLLAVCMPARGKHRADTAPVPACPPMTAPKPSRAWEVVIEADALPIVPRYLVAFEEKQARQRDERTTCAGVAA